MLSLAHGLPRSELTSLYQIGVALNLGFGAVIMFAELARRQFERSLSAIETQLLELTNAVEAVPPPTGGSATFMQRTSRTLRCSLAQSSCQLNGSCCKAFKRASSSSCSRRRAGPDLRRIVSTLLHTTTAFPKAAPL